MDAERQLRFTIAPFLMYSSIVLGAHLSGISLIDLVKDLRAADLATIGVAIAASTIPVGFLIGLISLSVVRPAFWLLRGQTYEVTLDDQAWDRIRMGLKIDGFEAADRFYAGVTWDHELLSEGVHSWVTRRWTAFNASMHSATALLLAHLVGAFLGISQSCSWWAVSAVLLILLLANAVVAWRHTMGMLSFQAKRLRSDSLSGG